MENVLINKMVKDLKETWNDVNDVLSVPSDVAVLWLWEKYDKKVSFSDCLKAYKLAL